MAISQPALDKLPSPPRDDVAHFAQRLQELCGERMRGLSIYGAAVEASFDTQRHIVRSALVLSAIDFDLLRSIAAEGTALGQRHIAAPRVCTPEFLRDSCDTFPLEFLEIQQQHVTVAGEDFFTPLVFDETHLRLQCEREMKVTTLAMHQSLLVAAPDERQLQQQRQELSAQLLRTLRGLLWISGRREPRGPQQLVAEAERLVARALEGVRAELNAAELEAWQHFLRLYADVQALGSFADGR